MPIPRARSGRRPMPPALLTAVCCTSAALGALFNAYVAAVLARSRQPRTANSLLLLHLALVDVLRCLETLSMAVPGACVARGFAGTALLPVSAWTLCGLNGDRYAAIALPLHYSRLVRSRRVALFLALAWFSGLALAAPPLFGGPNRYEYHAGACGPLHHGAPWYPLAYAALALLLPAALILAFNLRMLRIARRHRHRIVAALYEVTVRAQATITHQRNPFFLRRYEGRCAWLIIVQLVGSVALLYGPHGGLVVWEALAGRPAPPAAAGVAAALLAASPLVNGLVYGVKSRALRAAFKSFLRRQLYASEVRHEISRRGEASCSLALLRMAKRGSRAPLATLGIVDRGLAVKETPEERTGDQALCVADKSVEGEGEKRCLQQPNPEGQDSKLLVKSESV